MNQWHIPTREQFEAAQAFRRQVDEANRQRAYMGIAPMSEVAIEAYRGVVIDGEARRKANVNEARMGE